MADPLVVCSYLPGGRYFHSKKFRVIGLPCVDELDYCHGLQVVWDGPSTIVNVEHDMEIADSLIQRLLDCPYPLCTHAYRLRDGPSTYAHRNGPQPPAGGTPEHWIAEGDEWATYGGIGFCKITPEARVRPLSDRDWSTLDMEVTKSVEGPDVVHPCAYTGRRWHVHWPAIHHDHRESQ